MAHYMIFIPDVQGSGHQPLINVGLGKLLRDGEPSPDVQRVDRGPCGKSGNLYTWRFGNPDVDPNFTINDRQEWIESFEKGKYWVGVDRDRRPQPADLARIHQIPGISITLADGYSWMVPTLSTMPHHFTLDSNLDIATVIRPEYKEFYDTGMRIVQDVMKEFSMIEEVRDKFPDANNCVIPVEVKDGIKLITSALCLNYRITFELAMLLKLLDNRSATAAMIAFCELHEIRVVNDDLKKKLRPITIHAGSLT